MNIVNNAIICISCNKKLKSPVFLPCGHSICKHHVDDDKEEVENNKRRKIECNSCNETHEIPIKGFAPNRSLESLMKIKIDKLDLGEEYNAALNKCAQFKDLLEQFNKARNDPETRIHSVLSDLRNKVDLRREELKDEIDKEALKMIEKIDEYEKDCKESIKLDSNLDNKIEEWKNELEKSQLVLNTIERKTKKWNEISNKMRSYLKDLQLKFINLNKNLFLYRLDEFIYSDLKLINNDFHVFSVEINELSKYKEIKENKNLSQHVFKALGIEWNLRVYVEYDNRDRFIAIYLSDLKGKRIQNFKFDFDLVVLNQINVNKSVIRNIKDESKENCDNGYIIRFNDLLNCYQSYQIENDSCMLQVIIRKIEWI